jgi:hypothetical protein
MNAALMAAASLAFLAAQDMVVDGDQVLIPPRFVDTFHHPPASADPFRGIDRLRTLDQGPRILEPLRPLSNLAWITRQQRQLAVPIPSRPGGDVALDQTADRNRCGGDTLIGSPDGSKGAPLEQVELLAATGTGDHGSRATSRPDILRAANSVMVPQQPFFMGEAAQGSARAADGMARERGPAGSVKCLNLALSSMDRTTACSGGLT